jgi:hypothetical protein
MYNGFVWYQFRETWHEEGFFVFWENWVKEGFLYANPDVFEDTNRTVVTSFDLNTTRKKLRHEIKDVTGPDVDTYDTYITYDRVCSVMNSPPPPHTALNDLKRTRLFAIIMIWLLPPSPISKLCLILSLSVCRRLSLLTGEKVGWSGLGVGSYDGEKDWSSINHYPLWCPLYSSVQ